MRSLIATAWAHPGHGSDTTGTSLAHYLGEPVHSFPIPLVIVLLAAAGFTLLFQRNRP